MKTSNRILEIAVDQIRPDPDQPRKRFVERDLEELAASIKKDGLMQAITVRKNCAGYIIVAGERRWRASKLASQKTIKAQVVEGTAAELRTLSIVENLHRKDLNPIEESDAFAELLKTEGDEDSLVRMVGKPLTYIRNSLRLQSLSDAMREALVYGAITLPQALHLSKISHANQMAAFKNVDRMNSKEWGRMVEATAEIEQQAEMFAQPSREEKAERQKITAKYDAMTEQVERLVRHSFKRDELAILSSVLDGDTELRADKIDMIVKHLLLIRDALKRAKASQQSLALIAS